MNKNSSALMLDIVTSCYSSVSAFKVGMIKLLLSLASLTVKYYLSIHCNVYKGTLSISDIVLIERIALGLLAGSGLEF